MTPPSINTRMLLAAGFILAGFLSITGITLERTYSVTAEDALKERMMIHLSVLIASLDENDQGEIRMIYELPEPRFFMQGSGLYAIIIKNSGEIPWSSPSMIGMEIASHDGYSRGDQKFEHIVSATGDPLLSLSIGLTWGEHDTTNQGYTFVVIEDLKKVNQQIKDFRHNLWVSLGGVTVILLLMLTLILRWGLSPLREAAKEIGEIEAGMHKEIEGLYPKELSGLTNNINALIRINSEHEARYTASLGDLAHSLKTPLAVLRGAIEIPTTSIETLQKTTEEQIERMNQIVQYQLQRAATSGRTALTAPINPERIANKVISALDKVYADKKVQGNLDVSSILELHIEEGDLMELLGNLVDNGYKWCKGRVDVSLSLENNRPHHHQTRRLLIEVADDGPGISQALSDKVVQRGWRRSEEAITGHGLGLSLVSDIVNLYKGELKITQSALGGALIQIYLPI
ncbi:Sensor histidine kinase PhoQ [hydrothermal vent metagenome]|uniref:histidine kinase n=1 Tax=hydrothermal vent metagenome TaxID=652676 RepID=A0A3B0ZK09_9ZZZZ